MLQQAAEGVLDAPLWQAVEDAALQPGTQLCKYRMLGPLGAGGMGAVYKARDTRLDRMVAIKISTARFSGCFEGEARAIAALNHPHICALHDVGPNYLVMELVEGEILRGPLAAAGCRALRGADCRCAGAHRKEIVHRDLKSANILVAGPNGGEAGR